MVYSLFSSIPLYIAHFLKYGNVVSYLNTLLLIFIDKNSYPQCLIDSNLQIDITSSLNSLIIPDKSSFSYSVRIDFGILMISSSPLSKSYKVTIAGILLSLS